MRNENPSAAGFCLASSRRLPIFLFLFALYVHLLYPRIYHPAFPPSLQTTDDDIFSSSFACPALPSFPLALGIVARASTAVPTDFYLRNMETPPSPTRSVEQAAVPVRKASSFFL